MILTIEVRLGDGTGRDAVVAFARILGPDGTAGPTDYAVGAVEGADSCSAGRVVVGHDQRQGLWALLERACAALREADFAGP